MCCKCSAALGPQNALCLPLLFIPVPALYPPCALHNVLCLHDASLSCILKKIVYILFKPYFNLKKENDYGPS